MIYEGNLAPRKSQQVTFDPHYGLISRAKNCEDGTFIILRGEKFC